jgi:hypothetical protein
LLSNGLHVRSVEPPTDSTTVRGATELARAQQPANVILGHLQDACRFSDCYPAVAEGRREIGRNRFAEIRLARGAGRFPFQFTEEPAGRLQGGQSLVDLIDDGAKKGGASHAHMFERMAISRLGISAIRYRDCVRGPVTVDLSLRQVHSSHQGQCVLASNSHRI